MENKLLNGLIDKTNFGQTENGATKRLTTKSDLLDMFAMGGAMRNRSEEDITLMFRKAFAENPVYALKCLFYLIIMKKELLNLLSHLMFLIYMK